MGTGPAVTLSAGPAQVSDVPGAANALALALAPEVDLPPGAVIAVTGLTGTAAFFPDSLQARPALRARPHPLEPPSSIRSTFGSVIWS